MLHTKETLNTYLSVFCEQPIDKVRMDTERDFYMTPDEALSYGLIDEVIKTKNILPTPKIPSLKVCLAYYSSFITSLTSVVIHNRFLHHCRSMILEILPMPPGTQLVKIPSRRSYGRNLSY
jgi:hypothetical protein